MRGAVLDGSPVWMAAGASAAAGIATGVGALPLLLFGKPSPRLQNAMLGFAAGVMLAASFFSLILPALEGAERGGHPPLASVAIVGAAILLGAGSIHIVNRIMPHEHFILGRAGPRAARLSRIWLFVFAITLHNLPEGLAVGTSFGGGWSNGLTTALGIGLQNMPEGLAVAASIASVGYSRRFGVGIALASGLVEPIGGLIGAAAVSVATTVLPWGLGFAAGAMIFVVSAEIIPETHRDGNEGTASTSLMAGLVTMMGLDVLFG